MESETREAIPNTQYRTKRPTTRAVRVPGGRLARASGGMQHPDSASAFIVTYMRNSEKEAMLPFSWKIARYFSFFRDMIAETVCIVQSHVPFYLCAVASRTASLLLLQGAGLRRRHAKASWAYLFRMIKLLSSFLLQPHTTRVCLR